MIITVGADGNPFTYVCPKYDNGRLVLRDVTLRGERYYSPHLPYEGGIAAYYQSYDINESNTPTLQGATIGGSYNYYATNSCWYYVGGSHKIQTYSSIDTSNCIGWCSAEKYTNKIRGRLYDTYDKSFHRKNYVFDFSAWGEGTGTPAGGWVVDLGTNFYATYYQESLLAVSGIGVEPVRTTRLIYTGTWNGYTPYKTLDNHLLDVNYVVGSGNRIATTCTMVYQNGIPLVIYDSIGFAYYVFKVATTLLSFSNPTLYPYFGTHQGSTTNPVYIIKLPPQQNTEFKIKLLYERVSFSQTES